MFEAAAVDSAFWFSFAGFELPHRADPRRDLDLASYGLVAMLEEGTGTRYPDMSWEPKRAFELENTAATKLEKMGVKIVKDVDKASFQKIADPYLDKLAKDLGPHADKIKTLIRAIN